MDSTAQYLVSLVDRDSVTAAYAPGHAPTEARARTLRDHGALSRGVAARRRSGHRLAGQVRYYSVLNVLAAVLDRRGLDDDARRVADAAGTLESWLSAHVDAGRLDELAAGHAPDAELQSFVAVTHAAFTRCVDAYGVAVGVRLAVDGDVPRWMRVPGEGGHFWLVETDPSQRVCHALEGAPVRSRTDATERTLDEALAALHVPGSLDGLLDELEHRRRADDMVRPPDGVAW